MLASLIITTSYIKSASQKDPLNEIFPLIREGNIKKIEAFLDDYGGPHKQVVIDYSLSAAFDSKKPIETIKLTRVR